jgi:acetyl esterase/lipase
VTRPDGLQVRGEWVHGPGARHHREPTAVLLYLHGSGYAVASARTHRGLTSRLSAMTGLPVFACDYRLAPHHRFPAAADDVRAAWDWLREQGFPAHRIAVAGDSAGGHLAVDLALSLAAESGTESGTEPDWGAPAALALFSPLIDLTFGLAGQRDRVRRDPMVSAARARQLVAQYTRDVAPDHPRLAFEFAAARDFPPTLVQAGGAEMLAADAEHLARSLAAQGARCELEIWPEQMHVFQALPVLVPEAALALGRAASFLAAELAASDRPEVGPTALTDAAADRREVG